VYDVVVHVANTFLLHCVSTQNHLQNKILYRLDQDSDDEDDDASVHQVSSEEANGGDEEGDKKSESATNDDDDDDDKEASKESSKGEKKKVEKKEPDKTFNKEKEKESDKVSSEQEKQSDKTTNNGKREKEESDNKIPTTQKPQRPPSPKLHFKTMARLYEAMCQQDVDNGSANRRALKYMSASDVVEKLKLLESTASSLQLREQEITKKAKDLQLIHNAEICSMMGYWTPLERYNNLPPPHDANHHATFW